MRLIFLVLLLFVTVESQSGNGDQYWMCESSCECNCTKSITMDCSLPSPVLMSCSTDNCTKDSLCCNVHVNPRVVFCNSISLTPTTTHKTEDLIEFTTTINSSIITFFQASSFTQSTSTYNNVKSENTTLTSNMHIVKSEKRPSITPNVTTLSSIDSITSISINSTNTHNYKQQSKVPISSTTVDATTIIMIPQNTINITVSNFDSIQSTFNIVQSIIDTNQKNADTNTSTIITISVTIVVLSIILILIIIIVIFSLVIIVKRRNQFKPNGTQEDVAMENIYSVTTDQYTPIDQIEDTYYNNLDHINSSTALINDNTGVYSTVNNKEQEPHLQFDTTTTTSPSIPDYTTTTTGEIYSTVVKKDGEKVSIHVQPPPLSTHLQCDTTTSSPNIPDYTTTTTGEIYSTVVKKDGEKVTVHVQPPPLSTHLQCDTTTTSPNIPDCTTTTTGEIYSTVVRKDGEKETIHVQPPPLSIESTSDEITPTSTEGDTVQQEPIYDQPIKRQPPQKPQRPDIF